MLKAVRWHVEIVPWCNVGWFLFAVAVVACNWLATIGNATTTLTEAP